MIRAARRIVLGASVVALLLVTVVYGHLQGAFVAARTPAEIDDLLAPYDELYRPAGAGPFPAVVLFHGCGGLRDSLRQWAELLRDAGVLVVATDSYTGRRLAWQDVCRGWKLLGGERAGDVWVSLARVRQRPDVDSKRVALVGWSHGAWSVMELFALADGDRPPGLGEAPRTAPSQVAGLVLLYPYCGLAARARRRWLGAPPTLMLLAGSDSIVSSDACRTWGNAHPGVTTHVYPGVDHGFDQAVASGDWPSSYDEVAARDARRRVLSFLLARIGPFGSAP